MLYAVPNVLLIHHHSWYFSSRRAQLQLALAKTTLCQRQWTYVPLKISAQADYGKNELNLIYPLFCLVHYKNNISVEYHYVCMYVTVNSKWRKYNWQFTRYCYYITLWLSDGRSNFVSNYILLLEKTLNACLKFTISFCF